MLENDTCSLEDGEEEKGGQGGRMEKGGRERELRAGLGSIHFNQFQFLAIPFHPIPLFAILFSNSNSFKNRSIPIPAPAPIPHNDKNQQ